MNPFPRVQCKAGEEVGVDLNRNYGVSFSNDRGSSSEPCAQNYRGAHPFSEPETRAIRDFLVAHKDEIKFVYNFSRRSLFSHPEPSPAAGARRSSAAGAA